MAQLAEPKKFGGLIPSIQLAEGVLDLGAVENLRHQNRMKATLGGTLFSKISNFARRGCEVQLPAKQELLSGC